LIEKRQWIEANVSRATAMPLLRLVAGACIIEEGESLVDDRRLRGGAVY
jgi:hypothetical protein